ncbi:hypothetical protein B5M42_023035 [Paenibacillus athensensis]|uniref:Uncharacterized protein n=1 Tax=Paenibacillus athensensis TaxID=1967502 RepID=A0A4Y8PQ37_9BACL|nr:hypothetical protein [Paenibacillus athensensis]MCD1261681.1 hypothetical protein [Paenibacillus athensensis]
MMQRIRRKKARPRSASGRSGRSRPQLSLSSAQSLGVQSGRIVYLQRTIGNKAVGAIVASHLKPRELGQQSPTQLIRREVAFDESKRCYFSTYAPELSFSEHMEAQEFDSIMDTLNRHETYIDMPLGMLDQLQRRRLQSFRTTGYPAWLPDKFRALPIVQKRYQTVAHKIEQKRQELASMNKSPMSMGRADALALCGLLKRHQINGAARLEKALQDADDGDRLFGYLFQIHDAVEKLSQLQLSAVEDIEPSSRPRQQPQPRADYQKMERLKQDEELSFYAAQLDKREKAFIDDNVRYKQPATSDLLRLRSKFSSDTADTLLGNELPLMEDGQPLTAHYSGIQNKLPAQTDGPPADSYAAASSGAGLQPAPAAKQPAAAPAKANDSNSAGVPTAPTPAAVNYDAMAQKYVNYMTAYMLSQDLNIPLPYIPWAAAKGSMTFDAWKLHLLGIMKDYAIPFPAF